MNVTREEIADRVAMAMAEAGHPCNVQPHPDHENVYLWSGRTTPAVQFVESWIKACDLVGAPHRCFPCSWIAFETGFLEACISSNCEYTGRCATDD